MSTSESMRFSNRRRSDADAGIVTGHSFDGNRLALLSMDRVPRGYSKVGLIPIVTTISAR